MTEGVYIQSKQTKTKLYKHPGGFDCCSFYGGGSVLVDLLIVVAPIVCGFGVLSIF